MFQGRCRDTNKLNHLKGTFKYSGNQAEQPQDVVTKTYRLHVARLVWKALRAEGRNERGGQSAAPLALVGFAGAEEIRRRSVRIAP